MTTAVPIALPDWLHEADEAIDRLWEPLRRQPVLDRMFYAASAAGDFSAIWHVWNIAQLVSSKSSLRRSAWIAGGIAMESLVVNQGLKRLFRRPRPIEDRVRPHRLRQPLTSSFPSGHASAAVVATVLLREGRGPSPVLRAAALVVATSRIHVRIHHATDVAAGAVAGLGLATVWRRLVPLR